MLGLTFYWKEGAPRWVGTAAFSLRKETPKLFRLEVRPFFETLCLLRRPLSRRAGLWQVRQVILPAKRGA